MRNASTIASGDRLCAAANPLSPPRVWYSSSASGSVMPKLAKVKRVCCCRNGIPATGVPPTPPTMRGKSFGDTLNQASRPLGVSRSTIGSRKKAPREDVRIS